MCQVNVAEICQKRRRLELDNVLHDCITFKVHPVLKYIVHLLQLYKVWQVCTCKINTCSSTV